MLSIKHKAAVQPAFYCQLELDHMHAKRAYLFPDHAVAHSQQTGVFVYSFDIPFIILFNF